MALSEKAPTPEIPPLKKYNRTLYYGDWDGEVWYWLPGKRRAGQHVQHSLPWSPTELDEVGVDTWAVQESTSRCFLRGWTCLVVVVHEEEWTSIAFLVEGEHSSEAMALAAKGSFPEIWTRYGLESLLCSPPTQRVAEATT